MEKLIRLLQDDYKVGVEAQSKTPVIYIDPNKIDPQTIETAQKKGDVETIARQIGDQLDEQFPGLSSKLTNFELVQLLENSLKLGPFADRSLVNHGVCIVNQPLGNQLGNENILKLFGFTLFSPEHLKSLPGSSATWKEIFGTHEGEHCNQEPFSLSDPKRDLKILNEEIKSDLAALRTLSETGRHDIAQALMDIRSIATANGDPLHATSIFLNGGKYEGVTDAHLHAAKSLSFEMALVVAQELDIDPLQAVMLRSEDPQKFAKIIEKALNEDKIPARRDADFTSQKDIVAKEMGLSPQEFEKLGREKLPEIMDAHHKAKAEGKTTRPSNDVPHLKEYMRHYVGAVQRLFIADTSPQETAEAKTSSAPAKTAAEMTSTISENEKKNDAQLQYQNIADHAVATSLNVSLKQASDLRASDPDTYIEITDRLLQNKQIKFETSHAKPLDEEIRIVTGSMKISSANAPLNSFEYLMTKEKLGESGDLSFKYPNPYVETCIQNEIKVHRERKEYEAREFLGNDNNNASRNEEHSSNNAYRVTRYNNSDRSTGGGIPDIDLRSGDRARMTIDAIPVRDYFSLQAAFHPASATADLAQSTGPGPDKAENLQNPIRPGPPNLS